MKVNERIDMKQQDSEKLALKLIAGDGSDVNMKGYCIDRIFNKKGELIEEIVGHNLVVSSFLNLVMCLLKHQSGYSGIQYWAIGSGASSWDSQTPSPEISASRLTAEIGRVPILLNEISFLNSNYEEVSTPSNIIQIKHTFNTTDCNGVWREFGIYGGNATSDANSGILINKRHHAVITKTEEMVIERTMRFTLNLV